MRFLRSLVAVGALGAVAALVPRAAEAQDVRDFENSWFWGVKGGVMQFWTTDVSHAPAPLVGLDMLITRKHAALNLSLDQSFFDETGAYPEYDLTGAPLGTQGRLRIENMRRFTASLMTFPKRFGTLRPYAGVGFALNVIHRTEVLTENAAADTEASVEDVRSRGAMIFTGGIQGQVRRFAVFGQASLMPARNRSMFVNAETIFVEGGIRWNIGSSRERQP